MPKSLTDLQKRSQEVREKLKPFFNPEGIAVIGASREKGTIGWAIFRTLLERKEEGQLKADVYGVNIKGGQVLGKKLYKSILNIEGKVDHALFSVPAKHVPSTMEEAGEKGVKVATIVTAGFSEVGNVELEKKIGRIAKKHGIKVLGPNCMGVYDPYSGMDTLFTPKYKESEGKKLISSPRPGKGFITFSSQSGALGVAALDFMEGQGLGISKFISVGNMLDVEEEETLLYALSDPHTKVISMYVEGIEGGQGLVKVGKEVTKRKPIVVIKGGKTQAGARAAASHTASLGGDYEIYKAAFNQMGAILTEDLVDFVDFQKALALQPPARGNRVGIVTNGGGAGILSIDEAIKMGLDVPPFGDETKERFQQLIERDILPEVSTFANPVDVTGSGDIEAYVEATRTVLEDENFDAVFIIALHHPPILSMDIGKALCDLTEQYKQPVVMANFGSAEAGEKMRMEFNKRGVPAYPTPERGMRALSSLVMYGRYLEEEGELEQYLKEYEKPTI